MGTVTEKSTSRTKPLFATLMLLGALLLLATTVQALTLGPGNIARGKTAKADAEWNGWVASYATDGTDNFWNAGDWSQHWLEVDLGQSYSLSHVDLYYPGQSGGVTFNLYASTNDDAWDAAWNDATNWTFIGSGALSNIRSETITTAGTPAQYLKYEVFSAGDWVGLTEISAYGSATVPEPGTFLLLGAGMGGIVLLRRKSRS
jgi:F5/8 type C domain/PEP-CTERM motif